MEREGERGMEREGEKEGEIERGRERDEERERETVRENEREKMRERERARESERGKVFTNFTLGVVLLISHYSCNCYCCHQRVDASWWRQLVHNHFSPCSTLF